jgi:hypothetical protein
MWLTNNCRRGCRLYKTSAPSSKNGCPIEVALALAACSDGQVKAKHGLRGGLLEPGPNGTLVQAAGDASTWRCPEFRDRDDPDTRPQRGPRPSAGQLDLLDPRLAVTEPIDVESVKI